MLLAGATLRLRWETCQGGKGLGRAMLLLLAGRKSVGYCVRVGTKCVQGNETFTQGEEEKVVAVNIAYLEQHVPFVRDRLKRAGVRLAHLLNTTVGQ
jgi:hypothetical protein